MLKSCFAVLALSVLAVALASTGCTYHPPVGTIEPVVKNAYVCACSCGPGLRHRFMRIEASVDDAEQRLDNSMLLDSPDLDFQNGRFVGLRFPNVQIPKGATVFSAIVQFTAATGNTTSSVTVRIFGEASANAAAFALTSNNLGSRTATTNLVNWPLTTIWTTDTAGPDQRTPDIHVVVHEIVNQATWVQGNAMVILFRGTAGTGIRKGWAQDGKAAAAATLTVEYEEPAPAVVGPQELPICLPPALVPDPTEEDLANDCLTRVQPTLSGLAEACSYPSDCTCDKQPAAMTFSESLLWADKCDLPCTEDPVDTANDCDNFDPVHSLPTATNAPGDVPVCAAFSPLGAEVFGQRTLCSVDGTAHVGVSDESADPDAHGFVQFVGVPCPGGTCAVGMQYLLDIGDVTFGNIFHKETFRDLGGVGETSAGNEAMLSAMGDGSFARDVAGVAARGRRGSELKGVATTNDDPVDVNVTWGSSGPTCSVKGTLIGSVDPELKRCDDGPDAGKICEDESGCTDDPDCDDGDCKCVSVAAADLTMSLDVAGDILNQPPTANAGADQAVECKVAAVNSIVLDGSGSTDLDDNIALFTWLRGSRGGPVVGFDEISKVEQSLGTQNYILRVIDGLGQTDEDTTEVKVVDTMPPVVTCGTTVKTLTLFNHSMVNVGLSGNAVDSCEGPLPVTVKVFADEDDLDPTCGPFSPDALNLGIGTLRLRSERKGNSDGRVYLVVVQATDSSGNTGSKCCTVTAPLALSPSWKLAAQTQAAAAQAYCEANNGTPPAGFFVVGDGPIVGPQQ